jgi:hypothetical protein
MDGMGCGGPTGMIDSFLSGLAHSIVDMEDLKEVFKVRRLKFFKIT